ncbi:putative transcription factor C2H2 family [Helianthus annuus]|nr:putative transcription factor C2H2 family [Helianthus annuus]KAJ0596317.1 putative transcription factor C2H2 family [Helianthus annuus]KAJ0926029.1 putative transcription factor C2H2 family [Helianthus annuus]KAJ0930518.1 putative transcription factor C2H2 family [Helianthus annuus]
MATGDDSSSSGLNLEGVDDVEDFVWGNQGDSESMSLGRFSHLYDLMDMGNKAFRENRFEEAVNCFSRAHNIKPDDPIILNNRCSAYLRICQFLKNRPPSASEHRPLNGLDPTIHAGLALKDAEHFMNIRSQSATPYILKANALILLERFEQARDVIVSGLHVDASSNALRNLERITSNLFGRRVHGRPARTDDFDCTLCLKLLYEPITTPCGHTFCRSCLFQSMDRGNRCPLCRTVLFISPRTCAISVTLNSIIERNFPQEYAERKLEHESLTNMGPDLLPLFVMDVVLPCQKLHLNIFEARYRLMVRRIMEGNRRMGMVILDSTTGSVADYACEVEITDCEPLPDGRFFLEVESRRRFHILRNWDQDGYRVAEVEWVQDISPPEGSKEKHDLQQTTNKVAAYARSWIKVAQQAAQRDQSRLMELHRAEGLMPSTSDPESFSFWLASLTNQRPQERLALLRLRDTKERLRRGYFYMKAEEE